MSQSRPPSTASERQASERTGPRPPGHNMPAPLTPLVGRRQQVEAVAEMISRSDVRLLTLTGAPGIGKTRLGLQVAAGLGANFPDGVVFVSLAPIDDAELVVPAITQALDLREAPDLSLPETLNGYLQGRRMLLLLDNFEQVAAAAPLLGDLLADCPGVKALVTSRELLRLYGEHDYPVPPLDLPSTTDPGGLPDLEALAQNEAVALFVQRARAVSPGFKLSERNAHTVAEICTRLDGLPLAIELAAARILVLQPEELLARLTGGLKVLTGGARNLPERHRTLRATIEWSYNLLDEGEQALFRRLGVFVGGCTLDAIEQVCGSEARIDALDGVTSLIGKSLLQRQEGAGAQDEGRSLRFTMLETIREYAKEKLAQAGEIDSTGERHLDYFMLLAEEAEQMTRGVETALWMRRLDIEQNNVRAALEWSLSAPGRAGGRRTEKGLRLAGALMRYWQFRGYFGEGRRWYALLLSQTEPAEPDVARAKALQGLARMTWEQGDLEEAQAIYEQSIDMSRALGNDWGVASALLGLGSVEMWRGDYDSSRAMYEEALAIGRKSGAGTIISNALSMIGVMLMREQQYEAAWAPLEEALAISRELGDEVGTADTRLKQGTVAVHLGEYEQARALFEESLGIARRVGLEWVTAMSLARLGMIALHEGDAQVAEAYLVEGLTRARDSGLRRWSRWYLVGLAEVARLRGMALRAAKLIGASEGALSVAGARYEPATSKEIERTIAGVRAELDEETFARLTSEGRAMSPEEVIGLAAPPSEVGIAIAPAGQQGYPDDLTEREVEVLRLIAVGMSNQEIGQELVLSRRTVERHISNIYEKIGASGKVARAAATAYALRHGLAT